MSTHAASPVATTSAATSADTLGRMLLNAERIERFAVLDDDVTERAGELAPTLKLRRPVVYDRCAARITELYR